MAQAKGRVLTAVSGSIDNSAPHYAFTRNGKQFIGCVRKGWNTELHSDTQKTTALNFAYASAISNMLHAVNKAGTAANFIRSISYLFRYTQVGGQQYFYDDSLFEQVNAILLQHLNCTDFFTVSGTWTDDADNIHNIYTPRDNAQKVLNSTNKTAFRYQLASVLMNNADTLNLPLLYDQLSQCTGADYDEAEIYPLSDVFEAYNMLKLDLWRWAKIPVMTIAPENYDELLTLNRQQYDHRADFPAYVAEKAWRLNQ